VPPSSLLLLPLMIEYHWINFITYNLETSDLQEGLTRHIEVEGVFCYIKITRIMQTCFTTLILKYIIPMHIKYFCSIKFSFLLLQSLKELNIFPNSLIARCPSSGQWDTSNYLLGYCKTFVALLLWLWASLLYLENGNQSEVEATTLWLWMKSQKNQKKPCVVAHAYNPSTWEVEVGAHVSLGYIARPCLKYKKNHNYTQVPTSLNLWDNDSLLTALCISKLIYETRWAQEHLYACPFSSHSHLFINLEVLAWYQPSSCKTQRPRLQHHTSKIRESNGWGTKKLFFLLTKSL
jgi:hypothetical protein